MNFYERKNQAAKIHPEGIRVPHPKVIVHKTSGVLTLREIAEKYVREQLAIMDGSLEAAMRRIGAERYEKFVQDVLKTLPKQK